MASEQNIIELRDVDISLQKRIGDDNIFRFECDIEDDHLRIGLKEINVYSPYYYETFFTLDELQKKNEIFKSCNTLEKVKEHLVKLFQGKNTILHSLEDDKKIRMDLKMWDISTLIDDNFILDRKTIEKKDEGLMDEYNIQKENINLLEGIKAICESDEFKNEKIAKDIVNILNN